MFHRSFSMLGVPNSDQPVVSILRKSLMAAQFEQLGPRLSHGSKSREHDIENWSSYLDPDDLTIDGCLLFLDHQRSVKFGTNLETWVDIGFYVQFRESLRLPGSVYLGSKQ